LASTTGAFGNVPRGVLTSACLRKRQPHIGLAIGSITVMNADNEMHIGSFSRIKDKSFSADNAFGRSCVNAPPPFLQAPHQLKKQFCFCFLDFVELFATVEVTQLSGTIQQQSLLLLYY
jgi:hypothetical protein